MCIYVYAIYEGLRIFLFGACFKFCSGWLLLLYSKVVGELRFRTWLLYFQLIYRMFL